MDTSLWKNLNPTVNFKLTKKLFFNKFLFKVTLFCPGSRAVVSVGPDVESVKNYILHRTYIYNNYTYRPITEDRLKLADTNQLDYLLQVKRQKGDKVKIRCEEPYIDLYCLHEQDLYDILKDCPGINERLLHVWTPKNDKFQNVLLGGNIIMAKDFEFKYKIILKNKCDFSTRQALYKYLLNWGDQVKIPPGVVRNLTSSYSYGEKYFYAMDKDVVLAIGLIDPNLITQIFPIHAADQ